MSVRDIEAREQELIGGGECAKPAARRSVWKLEVPAGVGDVLLEELTAGLAGWRVDGHIFDVRANYGAPAKGCS